jgi:hypothetical protein
MKARVKATGEIINIADYARVTLDRCDSYGNPIELSFDEVEILQERSDNIDWEQRRYELVKAAMQGFCSNPHEQIMSADSNMVAEWSIGFADSLIKKLKGE